MRKLRHYFLTGLILVIPAIITIYVFYKIFLWVDANLGGIVYRLTGYRIPGLSFLFLGFLILMTILIGMLTANYIGKKLVSIYERLLAKIPLVRGVYMTIKQIMEVLLVKGDRSFREVVLLEYPRRGMYCIGFVTNKRGGRITPKGEELLIVFIPTTPNPTSGVMVLVPPSEVIPLPITIEQGLKLVISGGVLATEIWGDEEHVWKPSEKGKAAPLADISSGGS
ncbi:MAG: DUF502 domain-containing protein [Synergistetes bacterium]|nr:DUF502 domain-containing protein [Synergistota bacterium]